MRSVGDFVTCCFDIVEHFLPSFKIIQLLGASGGGWCASCRGALLVVVCVI